jgi:hypothetical protein
MRILSFILLAGCSGGNSLDAPDDCNADELHLVHGSVDERQSVTSYAFGNALGMSPGTLAIGDLGMPIVRIEFEKAAPRGATVPARGCATFASGVVGDCEGGDFDGLLYVDQHYWRFEIADGVEGCFRAAP